MASLIMSYYDKRQNRVVILFLRLAYRSSSGMGTFFLESKTETSSKRSEKCGCHAGPSFTLPSFISATSLANFCSPQVGQGGEGEDSRTLGIGTKWFVVVGTLNNFSRSFNPFHVV